MRPEDEQVRRLLKTRVIRLNAMVTGLSLGFIAGFVLFCATNFLVLKGALPGQRIGPHMELLNQVFIGYHVTFLGSLIGFFYAFITAGLIGFIGAKIYNGIAALNQSKQD